MKTVKPDKKLLNAIQAAKAEQPDIDVIAEYRRAELVMDAVARIGKGFDALKAGYQRDRDGGRIKINCPEQLLSALSRLWLRE